MDKAGRIKLPKPIRDRMGLRGGEALEVTIEHDTIVLTLIPPKGNVVKKGPLKVFDGPVPDLEITEAIRRARRREV